MSRLRERQDGEKETVRRRVRPQVSFEGDNGVTKQAFKDECDVNNIMARFDQTGMITHVNPVTPNFLDVSEMVDYRDALSQVQRAQHYFQSLTAKQRAAFDNDPAVFLDAAQVEENREAFAKLGLVEVIDVQTPAQVPGDVKVEPEPVNTAPDEGED